MCVKVIKLVEKVKLAKIPTHVRYLETVFWYVVHGRVIVSLTPLYLMVALNKLSHITLL